MKPRMMLALIGVLWAGAFLPAQAPAQITQGDLTILGAALQVGPEHQTVPLQTPTIVTTFLGSGTQPILVDASYQVKGELSGPQFSAPIPQSTAPNDNFSIPGLSLPGDYILADIRLEKDGRFVAYADHREVTFEYKQILITCSVQQSLS